MGRARARPPARLHDLLLRGHLPVVARNPRDRLRGPRRRLPSVAGAPPLPPAARLGRRAAAGPPPVSPSAFPPPRPSPLVRPRAPSAPAGAASPAQGAS